MKRQVVAVLDRTLGDGTGLNGALADGEQREPLDGYKPFKNRGPGGPPAWAWRGEDGALVWEHGAPPVPCGRWFAA